MDPIKVFVVCVSSIDEQYIQKLSEVLCYDEPAQVDSAKNFWRAWLFDKIAGEKFTIVAEESISIDGSKLVGVVRLWRTPYCGQKWLIEGLEVIEPKRGQGIGKLLVKKGIELLSNQGIKRISANINKNNIASIALHQSLGFQKSSSGAVNSYGEYIEHLDEYILKL